MLIKDEDKFCYVLFDRLFKYLMIMHAPLLVLIFDTQLLTAHDVTNRNPPCQAQKPGFLCWSLPISPSIRRDTRATAAAARRGDGVLPGMWAAAADRSGHRRPPPAPLLPRLPLRLPDAEQDREEGEGGQEGGRAHLQQSRRDEIGPQDRNFMPKMQPWRSILQADADSVS